jgi:hypothetical protein
LLSTLDQERAGRSGDRAIRAKINDVKHAPGQAR